MHRMRPSGRSRSSSGAASTCARSSATDAAHARRLVDEALDRGTDALVVVGGDGVISLALQALATGDVPLGIVPAGTGNDHAREYRLPTGDPEAARRYHGRRPHRDGRPRPHRGCAPVRSSGSAP